MGLDAKSARRVLGKRPGAVRTAAYRGLQTLAATVQPAPAHQEIPAAGAASDTFRPLIAEEVT
jgi:RNA polymerase sigma-70 factor (ECF subfamily)